MNKKLNIAAAQLFIELMQIQNVTEAYFDNDNLPVIPTITIWILDVCIEITARIENEFELKCDEQHIADFASKVAVLEFVQAQCA